MPDCQPLFDQIPQKFRSQEAGAFETVIQYHISGEGGGDWHVKVAQGKVNVARGVVASPKVTVQTDSATMAGLMNGTVDAMVAVSQGKLKSTGQVSDVMRFRELTRTQEAPDARRIVQIIVGFQAMQSVFVANELGLFTLLEEPHTLEQIMEKLKLKKRAAIGLLSAVCGLEFIERDAQGRYKNAYIASYYMVPGKPTYWAGALHYQGTTAYELWGKALECVKTDRSATPELDGWDFFCGHIKSASELAPARQALRNMFGPQVAERADLAGRQHLMAVGDTGKFVFHILQKYPELRATIVDGEGNIETVIKDGIAQFKMQDRITLHASKFIEEKIPNFGCDCALVSNLIQVWDDDVAIPILQNIRQALQPGAKLVLTELYINEEKTGPAGAGVHNLHMSVRTDFGYNRSPSETVRAVQAAGFENIEVTKPFGMNGLEHVFPEYIVSATVPGGATSRAGSAKSSAEGVWDVWVETPMGTQQSKMTLSIADGVVRGTSVSINGTMEFRNGKADGNRLTFTGDLSQPFPMTLNFNVTVSGDTMSGTVDAGPFGVQPLRGERAR